ncbi:tRNA-specific 2-thiouridylase [Frankliniella fusca]|uniref:tRNA-specific 2-thiouridylase n=1 Tax=Frankliniella fusca TaxID=407009 RepID=A0AAE1H4A7_9NEOP|nr:tRNA-specific 2-thiouridylase [Frankliniella fusca]
MGLKKKHCAVQPCSAHAVNLGLENSFPLSCGQDQVPTLDSKCGQCGCGVHFIQNYSYLSSCLSGPFRREYVLGLVSLLAAKMCCAPFFFLQAIIPCVTPLQSFQSNTPARKKIFANWQSSPLSSNPGGMSSIQPNSNNFNIR